MNRSRGFISLPFLLCCLLLAATAQLALQWCVREHTRVSEYINGCQLRLLCGSLFQEQDARGVPAGEYTWYEGTLEPGAEQVRVSASSTYSDDGLINYLQAEASAANHSSAVQRLSRLQLCFSEAQQQLAQNYALASKTLTGSEYLQQEALYIQASDEEVTLPGTSFLKGKCASTISSSDAAKNGLTPRFYYLTGNSALTLASTKPFYGRAVIINHVSITLANSSKFPDRLVLMSEQGKITLGKNVILGKALIITPMQVVIGAGCNITGLIIAGGIELQGDASFTPDASVVAPFTSNVWVN